MISKARSVASSRCSSGKVSKSSSFLDKFSKISLMFCENSFSTESSFSEVKILPQDANVDDILKVDYSLLDNEYVSFAGTVEIEWYLNGVLISNSNQEFIRLALLPGDQVYVVVKITDGTSIISQKQSRTKTILDVDWHIFDILISGLSKPVGVSDLTPLIEWKTHKTTSFGQKPKYQQVLITKTKSTKLAHNLLLI